MAALWALDASGQLTGAPIDQPLAPADPRPVGTITKVASSRRDERGPAARGLSSAAADARGGALSDPLVIGWKRRARRT
jgi:hypothetical protein